MQRLRVRYILRTNVGVGWGEVRNREERVELGEERRTNANSRLQDFDDGLAGLAHVRKSRSGDGGWDYGREANGHFRDDAEGSLCTDEQLGRVKSGRRLARSTSRFYHLTRGKDNSLRGEKKY